MLFNSIEYAFFLPLVATLFFLLQAKWRTPFLLIASCVFYGAYVPRYLLILFFLILVDYSAGILLESVAPRKRKIVLVASLVANLGVLAFFKYYGFALENVSLLGEWLHFQNPLPVLKIVLPIGLSFHTFQSMSYTIEVYRERFPAERNLLRYALYVLFFPQLVAGPIERPQHLLPQFARETRFDFVRVRSGMQLILFGLFKKMVIADRAAVLVNQVFDHDRELSGAALLLGAYAFSVQIYGDFSGYTDIARGSARLVGIDLVENFRWPYSAKSLGEFWHRWHISLSSWFRDYVYIPLGGNRVSRTRMTLNLALVFLASGIWHGAAWTFVAWGLLHGFYLIFGLFTKRVRTRIAEQTGLSSFPKIQAFFQIFITFHLVTLGWIFFRAPRLRQAIDIYARIFSDFRPGNLLTSDLGIDPKGLLALGIGVSLLGTLEWLHRRNIQLFELAVLRPLPVRWAFYYACLLGFYFLADANPQQFIYFQF